MAEQNVTNDTKKAPFGRKVFFLNPSYLLRTYTIRALREMEYEVYTIDNHRDAKNILHHNRDAMCFINVDSQLTPDAWIAFIDTFQHDPVLQSISVGLLSERFRNENAGFFFDKLVLDAGVTSLGENAEESVEIIKKILDTHGAMGRRQHVRVSCLNEKNSMLYWMEGKTIMHQMRVLDLSTVSLAVRVPEKLIGKITEKQTLAGARLVLNDRQFTIDASVFVIKQMANETIAILMLREATMFDLKKPLRDYIFTSLDRQLQLSINGEHPDTTDYVMVAEQNKMILETKKLKEKKPEDGDGTGKSE